MNATTDPSAAINPAISNVLQSARDFLTHEHSLFESLNLKPIMVGQGKVTFSMDLPEAFGDGAGNVHGGLMTIIIDSIFGLTVFTALEELKPIATVNLRTDYIASIKCGERAICDCTCDGVANEIANVTGRVLAERDNRLLATGAGAFMVGTKFVSRGSRL